MSGNAKRVLAIAALSLGCAIMVAIIVRAAIFQRLMRSLSAEFVGIDGTVTAYGEDGGMIRSWRGRFIMQHSDGRITFEDERGQRVAIYNGTVIVEGAGG